MIPKTGDNTIPENCRCISLVNALPKIFTQIINKRLLNWAETKNKIPEFQAGFRPKRGCADNVYKLNSIIQLKLSDPRRKLFAVFVDFKRAFDLVDHTILLTKLYRIGVSSKIIKIIKALYDSAVIQIKAPDKLTDSVKITKGVLQGEIISPLLFSFF